MSLDRRAVEQALAQVRPSFAEEGGDIRLLRISEEGVVEVALSGACEDCPMSLMHLKMGVEQYLQQVLPELKGIVVVEQPPPWFKTQSETGSKSA